MKTLDDEKLSERIKVEIIDFINQLKVSRIHSRLDNIDFKLNSHLQLKGEVKLAKRIAKIINNELFRNNVINNIELTEVNMVDFIHKNYDDYKSEINKIIDQSVGGILLINIEDFFEDCPECEIIIENLLSRMEVDQGKFLLIIIGTPDWLDKNEMVKQKITRVINFSGEIWLQLYGEDL